MTRSPQPKLYAAYSREETRHAESTACGFSTIVVHFHSLEQERYDSRTFFAAAGYA
jgi:hypothetical protein